MISNSFKKVNHINGTEKIDDTLLHIYSPNGLIQAMGYLKYQLGMKNYGLVFRGQADLYEKELKPSLYRGIKTQQSATFKQEELNKTITHAQKDVAEIFKGVKPPFVTPLLQHYGLKTEWLDVVDNIWIALWFACYETLSIKNVPFMILKQRSEKCEKIKMIEHLKKIVTTLSNKKTELQNIKMNNYPLQKQIAKAYNISKKQLI